MLLPFQGGWYLLAIPRALPWAMCSLAFQAVNMIHAVNHYYIFVFVSRFRGCFLRMCCICFFSFFSKKFKILTMRS